MKEETPNMCLMAKGDPSDLDANQVSTTIYDDLLNIYVELHVGFKLVKRKYSLVRKEFCSL